MTPRRRQYDADLDIRENPKLYMEIKERVEEMVDPNEEGAVNRLDTIRTRLLDYFQFYDCHNSENRTSDNIGTGVGLMTRKMQKKRTARPPALKILTLPLKMPPICTSITANTKKQLNVKIKRRNWSLSWRFS